MRRSLGSALLLPLVVIFLPSIGFYAANPDGFSLGATESVLYLAGLTVCLAIILAYFLSLLEEDGAANRIITGLILGLSIAAIIQGSFLLWKFGPLDGRGVMWDNWRGAAILELIGWTVAIVGSVLIAAKRPRIAKSITQLMLLISFGFALADLTSLDYRSTPNSGGQQQASLLAFHPSENKILIVLDTVQADIFSEILERHPQDLSFLSGFTFYPNTLGGYPTTRVSVPLILTGKFYRNETPLEEWLESEIAGKTIIDYYAQKNFGTSVILNAVPDGGIQQPVTEMSSFGRTGWRQIAANTLPLIDVGLFRCSPTFFKPAIYADGNWLVSRLFKNAIAPPGEPPGLHGDDSRFVAVFENKAFAASENTGEIKYFHLRGAHFPLQVNEHFNYQPGLPRTRESYLGQTRGAFTNIRLMLNKLKSINVYDNSDILIVGDHGSMSIPVNDMEDGNGDNGIIVSKVLSSSRPLFLHKPALSSGNLRTSDDAMHLGDTACVLSRSEEFCEPHVEEDVSSKTTRHFYFYKWGHEYWQKSQMPPMWEYRVNGDVRNLHSWSLAPGLLSSWSCDDKIDFSKNESLEEEAVDPSGMQLPYSAFGLSSQEANGRWSDGRKVVIRFMFSADQCQPKKLVINARPLVRPDHKTQSAEVFLNGTRIGELNAKFGENIASEFTLDIPQDAAVANGMNSLELHIANPFSPKTERRNLGFSFRSIVFSSDR